MALTAGLDHEIPTIKPVFGTTTTGLARAMDMMGKGQSTFGRTQPNIPAPEKTVGGGLTSGLAGAGAGAAIATGATTGTAAGPWGAAIGAVVGLAGYYLS